MSSLPMYQQKPLPVAARKAQAGLNLPSFFELTQKHVERICGVVNELLSDSDLR
jgi:dTDP-4-amino-4,6-dideoxygalactose transaminase